MKPKKKDGDDKNPKQDTWSKEKNRIHSRAYHAARSKSVREGHSEADLYVTSLRLSAGGS